LTFRKRDRRALDGVAVASASQLSAAADAGLEADETA